MQVHKLQYMIMNSIYGVQFAHAAGEQAVQFFPGPQYLKTGQER
jgi:hypothetical protein